MGNPTEKQEDPTQKREYDFVREEGLNEEKARVLRVVRRHARHFRSNSTAVDQTVAAVLDEIAKEIDSGVDL
jgi:hypothetical protein